MIREAPGSCDTRCLRVLLTRSFRTGEHAGRASSVISAERSILRRRTGRIGSVARVRGARCVTVRLKGRGIERCHELDIVPTSRDRRAQSDHRNEAESESFRRKRHWRPHCGLCTRVRRLIRCRPRSAVIVRRERCGLRSLGTDAGAHIGWRNHPGFTENGPASAPSICVPESSLDRKSGRPHDAFRRGRRGFLS